MAQLVFLIALYCIIQTEVANQKHIGKMSPVSMAKAGLHEQLIAQLVSRRGVAQFRVARVGSCEHSRETDYRGQFVATILAKLVEVPISDQQ